MRGVASTWAVESGWEGSNNEFMTAPPSMWLGKTPRVVRKGLKPVETPALFFWLGVSNPLWASSVLRFTSLFPSAGTRGSTVELVLRRIDYGLGLPRDLTRDPPRDVGIQFKLFSRAPPPPPLPPSPGPDTSAHPIGTPVTAISYLPSNNPSIRTRRSHLRTRSSNELLAVPQQLPGTCWRLS